LLVAKLSGDGWTAPVPVFDFPGLAISPFVTPDGKRLLFESTRRDDAGREDTDLWIADWDGSRATNPRPLGAPFDTPYNEHSPSMSRAGSILFNSARPGGLGRNDLYLSRMKDGRYDAPKHLAGLSSPSHDAGAYLAPDESYLLFWSDRPGGSGKDDVYIAFREGEDWSAPVNLGPEVNSPEAETAPQVSPDGKWLVFTLGRDLVRWPFDPARSRHP
jgi:Tol biopolymer transport system component